LQIMTLVRIYMLICDLCILMIIEFYYSFYLFLFFCFFFLMLRRPPRSTLFPTRRSSDLFAARIAVRSFRPDACVPDRFSPLRDLDRKSTRLNSSHVSISYAVFCLKKKKQHFHQHLVISLYYIQDRHIPHVCPDSHSPTLT